jgi:hypothetical protein
MATDAERMAAQRQRRLKAGLTQIAFWIPATRKMSFLDAARRVREDPDLEVKVHKPKRERAGA